MANVAQNQDQQDYQDYQDYIAYQKQSAADPGGWNGSADAYANMPPAVQQAKDFAINNAPAIGGIAGGLLGGIPGAGVGGAAGQAAQDYLKGYQNSDNTPETTAQKFYRPLLAGAGMAAGQGLGDLAAPYVSKAIGMVSDPVSDWLGDMAEEKAVEATGATGKQVLKFPENAGRELLDRGIVKFGNSQASVAQKATTALEDAGETTGATLADLDAKGATVDQQDIISSLRARAAELGQKASSFNIADGLSRMADRLQAVLESSGGNTEVPLSSIEAEKKIFQDQARNQFGSAVDNSVAKEASNIYRQSVEDAATKFNPETAQVFKDAKKTYALLSPIEEAATKRAATLAQSPSGGLMDTVATGVGAGIGGAPGAMIAAPARKILSSRYAPAMAGLANAASGVVGAAPALGALTPQAIQGAGYGLMAPHTPIPLPPNYSTIPGRNGQ